MMNTFERGVKFIFDRTIAFLLLLLFSPVFLICYIAIKQEDGGPAIFKQERIGLHGRPFYIYKFRSMRTDAERAGAMLCCGEQDKRLTKVGKFLRMHHLDELPQLWNVLIGDMSFVGPRPERKVYIDQIMQADSRYQLLYQVRPGVTSYATLHNGYTDTLEKMLRRLRYDLFYLDHASLWLDFKIMANTFLSVFGGKLI
ncbi:sugar transferase [Bacteroides sp. An19]|uniref:sugar transferase n=1 Tax=Bacteroides sp. An19 TaxID=1965580 RepID=UPI000B39E889|nr:sugar transferase [Bacteroides sp. An19]OUP30925.1 sugar transferase [Bacteroides sp. An19]